MNGKARIAIKYFCLRRRSAGISIVSRMHLLSGG